MINLRSKSWKFKADNEAQFELKKIGQKYTAQMMKFCTKKKRNFSRKKIKKTEVPKMTSKVVYELLLRSYGHF